MPSRGRSGWRIDEYRTEAVYRRFAITDPVVLEEGVEKLARLHEPEPRDRKVVPLKKAEAAQLRHNPGR